MTEQAQIFDDASNFLNDVQAGDVDGPVMRVYATLFTIAYVLENNLS